MLGTKGPCYAARVSSRQGRSSSGQVILWSAIWTRTPSGPSLWVGIVELCGFDRGEGDGHGFSAASGPSKKPVPAYRHGFDGALGLLPGGFDGIPQALELGCARLFDGDLETQSLADYPGRIVNKSPRTKKPRCSISCTGYARYRHARDGRRKTLRGIRALQITPAKTAKHRWRYVCSRKLKDPQ